MRKALLEVLHSLMFTYYWPGLSHVYHLLLEKQLHWYYFYYPLGCSLEGLMLKLKLQCFGHLMRRVDSLEDSDAGRDWGQEEKGTTEDEMAEWHHRLDGHEFE